MNKPVEILLTSKGLNASNAFDVRVSAVFTGPAGQKYEIPGRHIEGSKWIIKFQPPATGKWTYVTTCQSHPSDTGLQGVSGSVVKAAEQQAPAVFLAKDYVDKNSTDATQDMRYLFRDATAHARTTGLPVEIRLEANASYRLGSLGSDNSAALTLSGVKNVVINGQGSTLVGLNIEAGVLRVDNCENVIVKNLNIDYDPLPYSFGTITYVSGNIYRIKVDDGYIEFDHPAYKLAVTRGASWGVKISYQNGEILYSQPVVGSTTFKSLGNREWELDGSSIDLGGGGNSVGGVGLQVNDKIVIGARSYAQALAVGSTKNAVLEKITIFSSPGLSYYPSIVEDFVIRDCHVKVKEGRPISSTADGIHMRGARSNIMIDGCTFEGMLDDGINIHSSPMSVLKKIAPNHYELSRAVNTLRVGDRLVAIERTTGINKGILTVISTEDIPGSRRSVVFDKNIELMAGTGFTNADNLYNLDESARAFVIKDCTFNNYRGRGILLSCQNGLVYNNTFNILGNPSIHFTYETLYWGEGPYGRDIFIKNNKFIRKNAITPPIVFGVQAGTGKPLQVYENIFILGNTFVGFGNSKDSVVNLSSTVPGTIIFEGNKFLDSTVSTSSANSSGTASKASSAKSENNASASGSAANSQSSDQSTDSSVQSSASTISSEVNSGSETTSSESSDSSENSSADSKTGPLSTIILIIEIIVIAALLVGGGMYLVKKR